MKIFISGGCKNGKSTIAQRLAKSRHTARSHNVSKAQELESPLYYIATMKPVDSEDQKRIKRHQLERENWGFETIEQATDIDRILDICDCGGTFLLDSLTALLANEMFLYDGSVNEYAADKIICGLTKILDRVENIVIVSDYIFSDATLYDRFTESYRKSLAQIDRAAASMCDAVLEVVFSHIIVHKGSNIFHEVY